MEPFDFVASNLKKKDLSNKGPSLVPKVAMQLLGLLFGIILWILGFGALGVIKGSLAALFQAVFYGCYTPAGGLFALVTAWGFTLGR